jgi:hypothetical protein
MTVIIPETVSKDVELQNKKKDKLQRLAQVFSRANSVLTSRIIKAHVVDVPSKKAPAWSGASDVFFNVSQVRDEFDAQSLLSLQGLNFHELAHVRYTPRNGSEICRWVIDNNYWQAFNALEDMRIEGLLVSRFPSIVNWLTATVLDYLVREEKAITTLFALVRGRRYLPVELRKMARENYAVQEDIDELVSVIDEYRLLLFPQDTETAKQCIADYHNLLQHLPIIDEPNNPSNESGEGGEGGCGVTVRVYDPNGHADRPTEGLESSDSRPASKAEQQQDLDNLKKQDSKSTDEKDVVDTAKNKSDDNSDDVADDVADTSNEGTTPSDEGTTPSNETPSTPKSDDNFDDEFDFDFDDEFDDTDTDTGNGGNGVSTADSDVDKDIKDSLTEMLDEIVDELSKELDRLSVQVNGSPLLQGNNTKTPERADYNSVAINPELNLVAKSFARELERLRAKHDPAWNKYVDSGRLNVTRYLNGDEFDTLFDEWQEGRDDVTAIEAVICLDYSGSMSGSNADNAYQSMWAIKKALEQVNARTTVVLFDHKTKLLYSADEKAGNTIRHAGTGGSTEPEHALLYSQNVLATTEQPIRLLFMITDGLWNTEAGEEAVRQMKRAGVVTCQAIIADQDLNKKFLNEQRHEFELVTHVRSAKDVLSLGKDLVRIAISRQLVSNN